METPSGERRRERGRKGDGGMEGERGRERKERETETDRQRAGERESLFYLSFFTIAAAGTTTCGWKVG